jgi:serine---pyruvate transaminase
LKSYNFTPGPTPVTAEVTAAMSRPILTHRSAEFSAMLREVSDGLRYLFQTKNDVLTLTSSGSGAMEATIVNLLSPGDKVLAIVSGKFGARWVELCDVYGVDVIAIDVPWGEAVNIDVVANSLQTNDNIKAILSTHSETSTGVLHDIEALGALARERDVLLIVDAVSGLGANDLRTDAWGVDVVVTGSQKGLMLPPGLAFVSVSQRAWRASETSRNPRYYFSFDRAKSSLEKGLTPYTPAVSLLMGLAEILHEIQRIGLETIFAHHAVMAGATRAATRAMGLELFAKTPSNVLTSVKMPEGIDGGELLKHMKQCYGVTIANGMEQYKGKTIRIAHLGYAVDAFDMIIAVSALERGLAFFGHNFELGSGLSAIQQFLHMSETIDRASAG